MTEQTVWTPVEDGVAYDGPCGDELRNPEQKIAVWWVARGKMLGLEYVDGERQGEYIGVVLPDDKRLCRRVPAPQAQASVPMAVRAAINWLDSNSQPLAVKETEWTERWGIVLDWLDSQRQQGDSDDA